MERVGVRELKQNTSRVLDRVKAGETVEITEHGRPVALLAPWGGSDEYDRLVGAGEVLLGTQDMLAVRPVVFGPEVRLSDDLAALRDADWR